MPFSKLTARVAQFMAGTPTAPASKPPMTDPPASAPAPVTKADETESWSSKRWELIKEIAAKDAQVTALQLRLRDCHDELRQLRRDSMPVYVPGEPGIPGVNGTPGV